MTTSPHWLSLIISLPTQNATARMRIWRALKSSGCGVLRDGVYLLPDIESTESILQKQAQEVIQAGGSAYVLKLSSTSPEQDITFRTLFDRTNEYAALKQEIDELRAIFETQSIPNSRRSLQRLERDFAALSGIDFFPGPAKDQASTALTQTTTAFSALANPDEPSPIVGKLKRLHKEKYQNRIWATRKHLWVDRMASAWLITRFIDQNAKFLWLDKPGNCPKDASGFDFDGATFTHVGSMVTFEVLMHSFGLDSDPALMRLAAAVHFLDVGGIPVAEATGLEMILKGTRERCVDDDMLLSDTSKLFDDLYAAYTKEENHHDQ